MSVHAALIVTAQAGAGEPVILVSVYWTQDYIVNVTLVKCTLLRWLTGGREMYNCLVCRENVVYLLNLLPLSSLYCIAWMVCYV